VVILGMVIRTGLRIALTEYSALVTRSFQLLIALTDARMNVLSSWNLFACIINQFAPENP
jgi:hypothetical protein